MDRWSIAFTIKVNRCGRWARQANAAVRQRPHCLPASLLCPNGLLGIVSREDCQQTPLASRAAGGVSDRIVTRRSGPEGHAADGVWAAYSRVGLRARNSMSAVIRRSRSVSVSGCWEKRQPSCHHATCSALSGLMRARTSGAGRRGKSPIALVASSAVQRLSSRSSSVLNPAYASVLRMPTWVW